MSELRLFIASLLKQDACTSLRLNILEDFSTQALMPTYADRALSRCGGGAHSRKCVMQQFLANCEPYLAAIEWTDGLTAEYSGLHRLLSHIAQQQQQRELSKPKWRTGL
eukprot:scaffold7909_cov36-Prasinocladus_malaysianus.AAC.2